MENQIESSSKRTASFNFETHAWLVFVAGLAGIILSIVYLKMGCGYGLEGCGDIPAEIPNHNYQFMYYLVTAVIFICSGLFLIKKKKIGFILLITTIILVIISIFIPSHIFPDIDFSSRSLFVHSIYKAIQGFPLFFLPPLGTIFYFTILIKNIFSLNRWNEYVNDEPASSDFGYTKIVLYFLVIVIIIKLLMYISL